MKQAIILGEGLSGREEVREPRVRVSKITRKDKRVESQSKGTEKKDPNTTKFATWADKPHNTVSKLVLQRLYSTSTKELEGGVLQAVGSDTNL